VISGGYKAINRELEDGKKVVVDNSGPTKGGKTKISSMTQRLKHGSIAVRECCSPSPRPSPSWRGSSVRRLPCLIRAMGGITLPEAVMSLIRFNHISRRYQMGAEIIHGVARCFTDHRRREYVAIMGPSGSGKSTLMNLIGCLDSPTSGAYELNGTNVSEMDDNQLADVRNREIGFIFRVSICSPVPMRCTMSSCRLFTPGSRRKNAQTKALAALAQVGLSDGFITNQ